MELQSSTTSCCVNGAVALRIAGPACESRGRMYMEQMSCTTDYWGDVYQVSMGQWPLCIDGAVALCIEGAPALQDLHAKVGDESTWSICHLQRITGLMEQWPSALQVLA
jgi:hypothetical protein